MASSTTFGSPSRSETSNTTAARSYSRKSSACGTNPSASGSNDRCGPPPPPRCYDRCGSRPPPPCYDRCGGYDDGYYRGGGYDDGYYRGGAYEDDYGYGEPRRICRVRQWDRYARRYMMVDVPC